MIKPLCPKPTPGYKQIEDNLFMNWIREPESQDFKCHMAWAMTFGCNEISVGPKPNKIKHDQFGNWRTGNALQYPVPDHLTQVPTLPSKSQTGILITFYFRNKEAEAQ